MRRPQTEVPRHARRPGAIARDVRATIGETSSVGEAALASIAGGAVDQSVDSLTHEFIDLVYDEHTKPLIAEQVDRTWTEFRRKKFGERIPSRTLDLVERRARKVLRVVEVRRLELLPVAEENGAFHGVRPR